MEKVPVSVIIPVRNEERNIADCLKSVSWADDVIVVDGQSTDNTREIASGFTPTVIAVENDFAEAQRLKGLEFARHPWLLLLDADERVTDRLRDSIRRTIAANSPQAAYRVLRKNLYKGKAVHLHDPDYQLRLF